MRRIRLIRTSHAGADVQHDARGARRRRIALLASLTALALICISLAAAGAFAPPHAPQPPAPPNPPAPSITARPADPTNQTAARFAYADAQSGVGYQCQLDGGAFLACAAGGIEYAGPLGQGSHTFKVRAVLGTRSSDASAFKWTVDTVAPTASIRFPSDGLTLDAASWGSGCDKAGAICGEARDEHGVKSVAISIQQLGGGWWSGSAFDRTSESFLQTTLVDSGHDSTRWHYTLPRPADGRYTIHVRATDAAGNTTSPSAQAVAGFTIDTTPPPPPTIASGPGASTTARSATFVFADAESGARLLCRRDGSRLATCASPQVYGSLSLGSHRFEVEAADALGNTSAPVGYSWTIAKTIEGGKPFIVSGNASGPLAPGVTRTLAIAVANPNSVAIEVTALSVGVATGSSKPGCDGPANLQVTQPNISSSNPLAIPAGGHVALPAGAVKAPEVLMRDLSTNQDACKSATFTFTYSGSAHS